jgi:uncharacterized tellurite resistance protein B-like protein
MLFRWLMGPDKTRERPTASDELKRLVQASLTDADADAESIALVAAVAGLLSYVAYADRAYREEEQLAVHDALARMHLLSPPALGAVTTLLSARIAELAAEPIHNYTRVLVELTERTARLQLLDLLLDLAAADHVLSIDETNLLRRVANLLGLSEHDYVASQARHRERLSVL